MKPDRRFSEILCHRVVWKNLDRKTVLWSFGHIPIPVWVYNEGYDHWDAPQNQQEAIDEFFCREKRNEKNRP